MKKDIYYCIVLSDSQLSFLAGSKYGIDRMKVLKCLVDAAVIKETKYEKKGFAITLHIGQAALSEVELATQLGYDKKTVSRLLDKMAVLGIVTSEQTNRTSIHTIHCVSAWYANDQKILNPYYVNVKERHHYVGEIGDNGIDKDGIAADVSNDGIENSVTSACCNNGQPSLSLISDNNIRDKDGV